MEKSDQFLITLQEWMSSFMHNSMHHALRYSKESGWSMSQLGALMVVFKQGTSAVSDLGEAMGVSNPAASQMLDRLAQDELVLRTEDPDDRRVKQIKLTEKGLNVIHESLKARHAWLSDLSDQLSEDEKQRVCQALKVLVEKTQMLNVHTAGIKTAE